MNNKISMRDSFFDEIYNLAKEDKDIIVVSADMGAPALDKFRKDFGGQFINIGIAEHNLIAIATGLAAEGKKVFTYAIAPFITSRCHEFIKVDVSLMNIPINLVGVGTGFGYDDSGPTHHTTEDISIMRALPNLEILSPSDSVMAGAFAKLAYESKSPVYIRLERQIMPVNYKESDSFERGFEELRRGDETVIISTGNMVHRALEVYEHFKGNQKIGVIDLYRLKPLNTDLKDTLSSYKRIISLEEHLLDGGLGSIISEIVTDNNLSVRLKRIGLKGYFYEYGRDSIHKKTGLDKDSVREETEKLI